MIRRSALVIAAFVLAAAGVGAARASTSAGRADMEVRVTAKDFSFVLSRKSVPHGQVEFVIKNAGKTGHNFEIAGHTSKAIAPGKTTTMHVRLEAGSYPYKCTVDSHAKLGMKGMLRVT